RVYNVPAEAQVGHGAGEGESADWSKTFGAVPTVAGNLYPLCTLTYDLSWSKYGATGVNYEKAASVVADVQDYLLHCGLGESPVPDWYQPLPSSEEQVHNVLGAAKLAAGKIGV